MKGNSTNNAFNSVPQNDGKGKRFADLVQRFAAESADPTTPAYADALQELGAACAYSVLRPLVSRGYNPTLEEYRDDITHALRHDVDIIGDGFDLVNDAIAAILTETQKQRKREPEQPTDLERPYTERRLNRKVWIKSADSVGGWKTVETTPIKEVFSSVRRAIDTSRAAATDPRNGYTYVDGISTDPKSGELSTIYRRLPKYADLGGFATDFNGAMTVYTADAETVNRYESIVERMNLTHKQAVVLKMRVQGHGYKAIASYLGITDSAVSTTVKRIAERARNLGLTPQGYNPALDTGAPTKTPQQAAAVSVVQLDESGAVIARYASITEAARKIGVDDSGIRRVLNGKQKTAGGYKWTLDN